MPSTLQLQLHDGGAGYAFTIEPESLRVSQEFVYKTAADPPQIARITERWDVGSARLAAASQSALFDLLDVLLAALDDRTTSPITSARLIRDPTGSPVTERTLGPSTFQAFRVVRFEVEDETLAELRAGHLRTTIPVSLSVTADRVFADANGIVEWEQSVRNSYGPDGLHTLEWRTSISTAEGASAVTAAQTYAAIDISLFGSTYSYDTNGANGVEIEYVDGDEQNSRIPTRVVAVSRIRQHGIAGPAVSAGATPGDWELDTVTELTGSGTTTTTRAAALGPGSLAWVRAQRPSTTFVQSREENQRARREVRAEWVQQTTDTCDVIARLSGGHQTAEHVVVPGGLPVLRIGPTQPWRLAVRITATSVGRDPTRANLRFPAKLLAPWVLMAELSSEDPSPVVTARGAHSLGHTWQRQAELVYECAETPTLKSVLPLWEDRTVEGYLL